MTKISKNVSGLRPSPTLALNTKAKELAASGRKIINLTVGEPDFACPSSAVDAAIEALRRGDTRYSTPGGSLALRQSISRKLKKDNQLEYDPADIVVGIGAKEILFHTFMSILNPGDEVLVMAPYWVSYPEQVQAFGGISKTIAPKTGPGYRFKINLSEIETSATNKTRCIVLNSPNNPTGGCYSREDLIALGEILRAKDWWILSDEIYEHLSYESKHVSLLSLCPELRDRFILINGLAKGFAMTGWRVGYLASVGSLVSAVRNLQSQSSTCLPPFVEAGAIAALDGGIGAMSEKTDSLKRKRDIVVSELRGFEGVWHYACEGAFYAFINIQNRIKNSKVLSKPNAVSFCEYLLEKKGVACVPGEAFGATGFIRISYAVEEGLLRDSLNSLLAALKEVSE
jgi:aspartate aminotransferase